MDQYRGECMVSKTLLVDIKIIILVKYYYFGRYLKVKEILYTRVISLGQHHLEHHHVLNYI